MSGPQGEDGALPRGHFDVLILGPFALYRDGQPIDWANWQRKVQTLFRLLVTSPDKRRTRDQIASILWPDATTDAGFRNLRVQLHMLRRELGPTAEGTILTEGGTIALNPAYEWDLDLDRFEQSAASAGESIPLLEAAAGYYRGEPLAEDRYDDWAMSVRLRVQRTWRDLCFRLARLHREAGAPEIAVTCLERILESDPLDEEAMRLLLVSLGELDRRTEALRRYGHFAHRLQEELELTPGQETLAVVAGLRKAKGLDEARPTASDLPAALRPLPVIPHYDLPATGRLVGREGELGRILWTLPPMHEVAPRLVMVAGAAGMGKTRLLAEVASRARRAGLLTLAGGCFLHEGGIRYGPIRDALADYVEVQPDAVLHSQFGDLMDDLARSVPELRLRLPAATERGAPAGEDIRLLDFLTVTKALERIARDTPLVLILDDLQWADESTLQMLHFLVRRSSGNRILIAGSYRDEGEAQAIAALSADMEELGWSTSLVLAPLSPDALGGLVGDRLRGRCSALLVDALHSASGGNPLRALHLVEDWHAAGELELMAGEWTLPGAEPYDTEVIALG